jgi:predicted nicotinamide N-methyase
VGETRTGSSFRDPSGFLFTRNGTLLRQVNERYRSHYELLRSSGLYEALVADRLLVPHEERPLSEAAGPGAAYVLRPELIPFVSMPYEWSFGQRQAAALTTLRVQEVALQHGMILKDATAFNVQFIGARSVFIDTLSFERYAEGSPWVAYRQFCQHFLGPLALQARVDIRLGDLLRTHLDGVPLDLASTLLGSKAWSSLALFTHVRLHAGSISRHAATEGARAGTKVAHSPRVSRRGLDGLVAHLRSAVEGLKWTPRGTEWGSYEETHNYDAMGGNAKQSLVADFIRETSARRVLDLGANAGAYSRIAREAGAQLVVAADSDPAAVELGYRRLAAEGNSSIHSLLLDLRNPSPAQGWDFTEWPSFAARGEFDVVMALALVHHLAIGNNVPLPRVAAMLARLGRTVIVEWVPKADPQVQRLLSAREDIFDEYTEEHFRAAFGSVGLREAHRAAVGTSGRTLYRFTA